MYPATPQPPLTPVVDRSYAAAQRQILAGGLGQVHAVECESLDKQDPSGFFVQFSAQSGGIYVDMAIHDVRLRPTFSRPGS